MAQRFKLQGRIVTEGLAFPEGPVVMPDGSVIVVEIKGQRLVRCHMDGRKDVVAELGGGPNGAALGPDGKIYVCNNGGFNWITHEDGFDRPHGRWDEYECGSIQRVDPATGAVEVLYRDSPGTPIKGPNDIVFDAHGGFYFTDHGKSWDRLMDRGALYYAANDGSFIREVAFPLITPNGVGLSPDGKTLYASETETGRVWSWPVVEPGVLAKEPWPSPCGGTFHGGPTGYQRFDSLAVEANGNVCVATLVNAGISVFAPEGGLVEFWEAPEPYCTNIAFGGADLRKAYITLSGYGQLLEVDWPRPGLALAY
jgi:gluconolactonase